MELIVYIIEIFFVLFKFVAHNPTMIIVKESVSRYIRQQECLYARMKKALKAKVQLGGRGCSLFLKWENNQLQNDMYTAKQTNTLYFKVRDNMCVLTVEEELAVEKEPDVFYYRIYTPFPETTTRWLEPSQRRKAVIDDVLKEMRKDDTRTFGQRMSDLRKEKLVR